MAIHLSIGVVDDFCFFDSMNLEHVEAHDTIETVMRAVHRSRPNFCFSAVELPNGKKIVSDIQLDIPDYTAYAEDNRFLNHLNRYPQVHSDGDTAKVWQYYRSVTISGGHHKFEIRTITPPYSDNSFATTALNQDVLIPENYQVITYNLIWRLVKLDLSAQADDRYMKIAIQY
ncbi:MAG: hypothetical protein MI750_07360 [Xanthomonadales bacterium]|jgi:hypothetical protein|nr:hypothetical protein [Xanthomonadales bacterium]